MSSEIKENDIKLSNIYDEIEDFVDETLSKIRNFKNHLSNEEYKNSFTTYNIRMTLSLFNRSPSGYREFKEFSV